MKLAELNPRWVSDKNRHGQGISFNLPNHQEYRTMVYFKNPIDNGAPVSHTTVLWDRTGDSFDNLTLTPSINSMLTHGDTEEVFQWHGFITNGEIITL